ncbi:type VI secretion system contractile sheath small subunit [Gammaproteobacteria bacterium AS21]|jgi:type VI secretion system protein ImpB
MAKEATVAPKERINIKYVPATGGQEAEVELPLKLMVLGDFTGTADDTAIADRNTVSVDKNNFSAVLRESNLSLQTSVPDKLRSHTDGVEADLALDLKFASLNDFKPDSIAQQVPEIKKLIDLREALVALKGPLGNVPAFREKLQELLGSEQARDQLLSELNLADNKTN